MDLPSSGWLVRAMAFFCLLCSCLSTSAVNLVNSDSYLSNEVLTDGEDIEGFTGSLKWRVKEFSLPGTGLDIDLYRSYGYTTGLSTLGLWHIETPRVVLNAAFDYDNDCDRAWCRNHGNWGVGMARLEIPGRKPVSLVKSNEATNTLISVNGEYGWKVTWSISGDSLKLTGYSPDGLIYKFDFLDNSLSKKGKAARAVHATQVTDPYGNYIAYSYSRTRSESSYLENEDCVNPIGRGEREHCEGLRVVVHNIVLPNTITASDGRKVKFDYMNVDDVWTKSKKKLKNISIIESTGNRTWSYEYSRWTHSSPVELSKVRRPDGLSWDYFCELTNIGNPRGHRLAKVTLPNGAKINYDYAYHQEIGRYGAVALSERILSIPGQDNFKTTYSFEEESNYRKFKASNPISKKVTTFHNNKLEPAFRGKIAKEQIFAPSSSSALRTTKYFYKKWSSIGQHDYLGHPVRLIKVVTDGFLETAYSNFNSHYQSRAITERYGNDSRVTKVEIENRDGSGRQFIGLLKKKIIEIGDGKTWTMSYAYNGQGRLKYSNQGMQYDWYEYHSSGKQQAGELSVHSYRNHIGKFSVEYSSYYRGIAQKEVYPGNHGKVIKRTVRPDGFVIEVSDGADNFTSYDYDSLGRVTSIQEPGLSKQHIEYKKNSLTTTLDGSTYRIETMLDGLGRPTDTAVSIDESTVSNQKVKYDGLGRQWFVTYESPYENAYDGKYYFFDALGRVVREKDSATGGVTEYCYGYQCASDFLPGGILASEKYQHVKYAIRKTDANGFNTIYLKDGYGNYGSLWDALVYREVDKNGNYQLTELLRNKAGLIQTFSQDGVSRDYTYTPGADLLTNINEPERSQVTLAYDNSRNLRSREIEGVGVIRYDYDELNRLIGIDYPSGYDVSYEYYPNNLLKVAKKGLTTRRYTYTPAGSIETETLILDIEGGKNFTTAYHYNDTGWLEGITYPNGFEVTYELDDLGRIEEINSSNGVLVTHIDYHVSGAPKSYQYSNGYTVTQEFDKRHRIYRIHSQSGSEVAASQRYDFDYMNNITAIQDTVEPANSLTDIQYDGLSRFISANCPWGFCGVRYNRRGDILSKSMGTLGSLKYFYDANTNRLDHTTGTNYQFSYNELGDVVDNGQFNMTYDLSGDMLNITSKNGEIDIDYEYDAHNLRSLEIHNDKAIMQVHNKEGSILYEENLLEKTATNYVYFDGKVIAEVERDIQPELSCESGWTLNGNSCTRTSFAESNPGCPDNLSMIDGICRAEAGGIDAEIRCPDGFSYAGNLHCMKYVFEPAAPKCPQSYFPVSNDGWYQCSNSNNPGSTPEAEPYCVHGKLSGYRCRTAAIHRMVSPQCNEGYTVVGTQCFKSYPIVYFCPSGYEASGIHCLKTETVPAIRK